MAEGVSIPAAATIRTWAREDDWASWADGQLQRTHGKTLKQLQRSWLQALRLSQETQIDAMLGRFADNPADGAIRIKAAESVQRIIAQAGLMPSLPAEPAVVEVENFDALSGRAGSGNAGCLSATASPSAQVTGDRARGRGCGVTGLSPPADRYP